MLRRHQDSQLSHIDRIRRNIPSAQQARNKLDDLTALAANEEAMRLKNEHAYARAIQNDNKSYTPSVNVIIVKQSVDYP